MAPGAPVGPEAQSTPDGPTVSAYVGRRNRSSFFSHSAKFIRFELWSYS